MFLSLPLSPFGTVVSCVVSDGKVLYLVFLYLKWYSAGWNFVTILFTRYIRELIQEITNCNVGCNIGRFCTNLLACADDMVLLASSCGALQYLINLLESRAGASDMSFNAAKTVCMLFQPVCKNKIVANLFPNF